MPTILAFYTAPGDWRDGMVRLVTGSPYSHVELLRAAPVEGRAECISASKRDGNRVRVKTITFAPGHWQFVRVHRVDAADAWARATRHLSAPYDNVGAALSAVGLAYDRPGRWFCSELVGDAIGIPHAWAYSPGELFEVLEGLGAEIMEGDICRDG